MECFYGLLRGALGRHGAYNDRLSGSAEVDFLNLVSVVEFYCCLVEFLTSILDMRGNFRYLLFVL